MDDPLLGLPKEEADRLLRGFGDQGKHSIPTDSAGHREDCAISDDGLEGSFEDKIEIPDFPTDVFPISLETLVLDLSRSMGVPVSATGTIVLTILSAAIGNTTKISPKTTFEISPFIWAAIAMPTGSGKSPLLDLLVKPVVAKNAKSYSYYMNEKKLYELALRAFKRNEGDVLPDEPALTQYMVQDTTVESLAPALESQPRGLLGVQDELAGWLRGMDQYRSGKGSDRQLYLQLFNSGSWSINRRSGVRYVPQTGLSIIGNLTPEAIPALFGGASLSDGLLQRFVFAIPETEPMRFRRESITGLEVWNDMVDFCYSLPITTNELGFVVPKVLRIQGKSLDIFEDFYNVYGKIASVLPVEYRGFISKLYLYCLKFAGVLHTIRAYRGGDIPGSVGEKTMLDAVVLIKFYFGQIHTVLRLMKGGKESALGGAHKRVIQTLHDLQGEVKNGMLKLSKIVDRYNEGLPANFQITSQKIASILRNDLGLDTRKGTGNLSSLLWEDEKLEKYFKRNVTNITPGAKNREKVTLGTLATAASEENSKSGRDGAVVLSGVDEPTPTAVDEGEIPTGQRGAVALNNFILGDV